MALHHSLPNTRKAHELGAYTLMFPFSRVIVFVPILFQPLFFSLPACVHRLMALHPAVLGRPKILSLPVPRNRTTKVATEPTSTGPLTSLVALAARHGLAKRSNAPAGLSSAIRERSARAG